MRKTIPRKYVDELLEILQKTAKDRGFLDEFLQDLLTPTEYDVLAVRWQIVKLIAEGMGQREITDKLRTGIATVTRGSRELRDKHGAFMKILGNSWQSSHST